MSQFVSKTETIKLCKKTWTFLNQIHETPPTDPTELLQKKNKKREKTNTDPHKFALFSSFWYRNDTKSGSCSLAFCFSVFSVFYYFKKHTLSHSENYHFSFIGLRFSDVWVRILNIYVTLWYIWSIFSCVWTDVFSAESYISRSGNFWQSIY